MRYAERRALEASARWYEAALSNLGPDPNPNPNPSPNSNPNPNPGPNPNPNQVRQGGRAALANMAWGGGEMRDMVLAAGAEAEWLS